MAQSVFMGFRKDLIVFKPSKITILRFLKNRGQYGWGGLEGLDF